MKTFFNIGKESLYTDGKLNFVLFMSTLLFFKLKKAKCGGVGGGGFLNAWKDSRISITCLVIYGMMRCLDSRKKKGGMKKVTIKTLLEALV